MIQPASEVLPLENLPCYALHALVQVSTSHLAGTLYQQTASKWQFSLLSITFTWFQVPLLSEFRSRCLLPVQTTRYF